MQKPGKFLCQFYKLVLTVLVLALLAAGSGSVLAAPGATAPGGVNLPRQKIRVGNMTAIQRALAALGSLVAAIAATWILGRRAGSTAATSEQGNGTTCGEDDAGTSTPPSNRQT